MAIGCYSTQILLKFHILSAVLSQNLFTLSRSNQETCMEAQFSQILFLYSQHRYLTKQILLLPKIAQKLLRVFSC